MAAPKVVVDGTEQYRLIARTYTEEAARTIRAKLTGFRCRIIRYGHTRFAVYIKEERR